MNRQMPLFVALALLPAGLAPAAEESSDRHAPFRKEEFIRSAGEEKVLRIGLVDCVAYALKQNSEILIKKIEPRLREDDVKAAEAEFEPAFAAAATHREGRQATASESLPDVLDAQTTYFSAGVSGQLTPGTSYSLDFLLNRYGSNLAGQRFNPYFTARPAITITQPLLRNFGIEVNRATITIASNSLRQSKESFQETVMDTVSRAKTAYYNYVFALEGSAVADLAFARAKDLFESNRARYAKGLISSVDLLETETAVSQREKSLLVAEGARKKSEDDLKFVTNLVDDPRLWNARLEIIDRPGLEPAELDLPSCLENAFHHRPDYRAALIDLESRDIRIAVAKNSLFPTVDLVGSFGLNGLGEDLQEAVKEIDTDYYDWSVGVRLRVPWGGGERAQYDQKRLEKAQALLALKRLEQKIILEVRDRVREVDIQRRQVEVATVSRNLETQTYDAQKDRYQAGQVSTHDMLDYQDRLAQAEFDYVKALIDHAVARVNLDKAQGLTLVNNNIQIEE